MLRVAKVPLREREYRIQTRIDTCKVVLVANNTPEQSIIQHDPNERFTYPTLEHRWVDIVVLNLRRHFSRRLKDERDIDHTQRKFSSLASAVDNMDSRLSTARLERRKAMQRTGRWQ